MIFACVFDCRFKTVLILLFCVSFFYLLSLHTDSSESGAFYGFLSATEHCHFQYFSENNFLLARLMNCACCRQPSCLSSSKRIRNCKRKRKRMKKTHTTNKINKNQMNVIENYSKPFIFQENDESIQNQFPFDATTITHMA